MAIKRVTFRLDTAIDDELLILEWLENQRSIHGQSVPNKVHLVPALLRGLNHSGDTASKPGRRQNGQGKHTATPGTLPAAASVSAEDGGTSNKADPDGFPVEQIAF